MNETRSLLYAVCALLLVACGGGGGSGAPPVTVTVTPSTAIVMVGQQIQLTATTTNAAGPVTWSSSNTAVATVSSIGLVRTFTLGQVTITATSQGASGAATLTSTTGLIFASVSTGANHTCGVTLGGVAYCWGNNSSGQLGNGATANSATPVPVSGGLSFSSVSAGGNQTCGVASFDLASQLGGAVYCWGDNGSGQLGNDSTTDSAAPTAVAGGHLFANVSVGGKHVCGISGGGVVYCWGDNSFGQLGNGTTTESTTPVAVHAGVAQTPAESTLGASQVSAGSTHTCSVILEGGGLGEISCWGDNSAGQFGLGTTVGSNIPVLAYLGLFASAGTLYSCSSDLANARCSGNNTYGQLGNGTTTSSSSQVVVAAPTGSTFLSGVSAGSDHACGAVNGTVGYCWGNNSSGQLGDGTTTNRTTPVIVAGSLSFVMMSAGGHHTCSLTSSTPPGSTEGGAVYCWGDNTFGQLGNSWTVNSSVPVNVAAPP